MLDISAMIEDKIKKDNKIYPVRSNWASQVGHPCIRSLVYNRLNWKEKAQPGVGLMLIWREGRRQEVNVLQDMTEAGVTVIRQQEPFEWAKYLISGRIDGMIKDNGSEIPLEIKTTSPFAFDKLNTDTDMYEGRWYYRNYLAQMTVYLLMTEKEQGLFVLKNKSSGRIKQIPYDLVYEFGEQLVKKIEKVNECVEMKKYPDRMDYDEDICNDCFFFHLCLPDQLREGAEIIDSQELEELLDRRAELKIPARELVATEKLIKNILGKGREKLICGDWVISGKSIHRKGYSVPDIDYWKYSYAKLK